MDTNQLNEFDPNLPFFLEQPFPLPWQMTRWEKYAFISILQNLKPKVAIEIGNADGGSLQVIEQNCEKIYAIDFQPIIHHKLRSKFSNKVQFVTGDSVLMLPEVLESIEKNKEELGFVFIDGNHSANGVKSDINAILHKHLPKCNLMILIHDGFNPECRKGIIEADWHNCPHVHYVDIDFIPGNFYFNELGSCKKKSLWNGLACALLKPENNTSPLIIRQTLRPSFETLYKHSYHNSFRQKIFQPLKERVKRIIK